MLLAFFFIMRPFLGFPEHFDNIQDASGSSESTEGKSSPNKFYFFQTSWCGWSKKFLPVWNQLDKLQQIRIPMEKIDCEKNKEQCDGIPGFPYVVLEKNSERIEYKGNRTAKDIVNFVKTNV